MKINSFVFLLGNSYANNGIEIYNENHLQVRKFDNSFNDNRLIHVVEDPNDEKIGLSEEPEADDAWEIPFQDFDVHMEVVGIVLMCILITMSNAGGLSGAGSNIPIMLIFFDFTMARAVPVSAFVAVCSTSFRFILNFS